MQPHVSQPRRVVEPSSVFFSGAREDIGRDDPTGAICAPSREDAGRRELPGPVSLCDREREAGGQVVAIPAVLMF